MKLIFFNTAADNHFHLRPDTALLRCGDPFWVPEGADIEARLCLVVRINRVGKAIQRRFAHRYYSEVGLGVAFADATKLREAAAKGLPWEIATCFDRSAAVSQVFLPQDVVTGEAMPGAEFPASQIDEKIALVSQSMTVKMGDLIYVGIEAPRRVEPGDRIVELMAGVKLLDFQIK